MDYFSSVWFKVGLVLLALLLAGGSFLYYKLDGFINQVIHSSRESRSKLRQSIQAVQSVSKVVLWILPIYVFIAPFMFVLDQQFAYSLITLVPFGYITVIGAFLTGKKILKALDK